MPPVLKAGASITCTAATALLVSTGGGTYWYGVTFIATAMSLVPRRYRRPATPLTYRISVNLFVPAGPGRKCRFTILIGPGSQFEGSSDFINCTFSFSNVGQALTWTGGWHWWRNTPIRASSAPFRRTSCAPSPTHRRRSCLRGWTSLRRARTAVGTEAFSGVFATFKNCKMHTGRWSARSPCQRLLSLNLDLVNSDVRRDHPQ